MGREKDMVRVSGLRWFADREQGFTRFYDDNLQRVLEYHEYSVRKYERVEKGLPLGPHLEPRFQNLYYGIDGTLYVLSLILDDLNDSHRVLWNRYRAEPFGAVWETGDEFEPFRPVTIVARDGDTVVFYNDGMGEDFRLGMLTNDTDENDDRVVRDHSIGGSELAGLQLALDKKWNPEFYGHKPEQGG